MAKTRAGQAAAKDASVAVSVSAALFAAARAPLLFIFYWRWSIVMELNEPQIVQNVWARMSYATTAHH